MKHKLSPPYHKEMMRTSYPVFIQWIQMQSQDQSLCSINMVCHISTSSHSLSLQKFPEISETDLVIDDVLEVNLVVDCQDQILRHKSARDTPTNPLNILSLDTRLDVCYMHHNSIAMLTPAAATRFILALPPL